MQTGFLCALGLSVSLRLVELRTGEEGVCLRASAARGGAQYFFGKFSKKGTQTAENMV